eukprot:symbB.v1.2.014278.t1/scaffold1042.1/size142359/2
MESSPMALEIGTRAPQVPLYTSLRPVKHDTRHGSKFLDGLQRGLTTWTALQVFRRLRSSRRPSGLPRRAGDAQKNQVATQQDVDEEQLEYLNVEDEDDSQAELENVELAAPQAKMLIKKGKVRHADLVNPPVPDGIHPYTPGEGYGSNAIPFAGISPKTSKRRNPANRMKTIEMLKKAKKIADQKSEELAQRRARLPSQQLPLPKHLFEELEEKGWFQALKLQDLKIEVRDAENPDSRWIVLHISGEEEKVKAGVLRLMSIIVPPRAA